MNVYDFLHQRFYNIQLFFYNVRSPLSAPLLPFAHIYTDAHVYTACVRLHVYLNLHV